MAPTPFGMLTGTATQEPAGIGKKVEVGFDIPFKSTPAGLVSPVGPDEGWLPLKPVVPNADANAVEVEDVIELAVVLNVLRVEAEAEVAAFVDVADVKLPAAAKEESSTDALVDWLVLRTVDVVLTEVLSVVLVMVFVVLIDVERVVEVPVNVEEVLVATA